MSGRKCGNCRHYEPSPIWRSGWCRNPRLFGPQDSHLVRQEDLDCAHRIGNYWEPAEADDDAEPGESQGAIAGIVRPLRLFGPGPRLVAAASGSGSGSGRFDPGGGGGARGGGDPGRSGTLGSSGYGGDRDAFGGGGVGAGGTGGRSPGEGLGRPDRTGHLPGQERIVSYEPEERYWTDYLRIALPVVGLLLMLGLFWYWAANLIGGDDDEDEPRAELIATATATPTIPTAANPTQPSAGVTPTTGGQAPGGTTPVPTTAAPDDTPTTEAEAEEPTPAEPDEPAGDGGEFPVGSTVIVNDNDVNFRSGPSTETDALRTLSAGEELEVTGPIETDANGLSWLPVRDIDQNEGYVAVDFVDPAE